MCGQTSGPFAFVFIFFPIVLSPKHIISSRLEIPESFCQRLENDQINSKSSLAKWFLLCLSPPLPRLDLRTPLRSLSKRVSARHVITLPLFPIECLRNLSYGKEKEDSNVYAL